MRRAVRVCFAGLALALLFWFALAPSSHRDALPTSPAPGPAPGEAPRVTVPTTAGEPGRPATHPTRSELLSSAEADRVAVEVEVVDWELRVVAGATVTLFVPKHRQAEIVDLPAPSPNAWETDAHGRCTVSFPERARRAFLLFAEKNGVGTSGRIEARPDEETGRVRLILFPPAHLSGRVLRGVGIPAPRVTVRFLFENPLSFRSGQTGRTPGPIETDEGGRFETDLDSGARYLVWASDGEVESDKTVVYGDAGSRQELTLWLEGALTIEARLLDPSGAIVPGGSVLTWEQDPPQPLTPGVGTPGAFLRVDRSEGGRFVLSVPRPGTYSVVGFGDGFASSLPAPVEVNEGTPHPEVALSLLPPSSIAGRLRRANGSPAKSLRIQAVADPEGQPYAGVTTETGSDYLHPTVQVRTGEDGTFRFSRLHPLSTYTLLIDSDLRTAARMVPAGTENLEIVVPERTSATLTVVLHCGSPEQEHEYTGASLWREIGESRWVQEGDPQGPHERDPLLPGTTRLRFPGLFPGDRYLLSAWASGHGATLEGPWTAKVGQDEIVILFEPPSTIEVEVTDENGRPLPCASVFCERITECDGLDMAKRALTPASGVVRFEDLGPGPYRLAAVRGAARSEWTEVEIAGGEARTVPLSLEP